MDKIQFYGIGEHAARLAMEESLKLVSSRIDGDCVAVGIAHHHEIPSAAKGQTLRSDKRRMPARNAGGGPARGGDHRPDSRIRKELARFTQRCGGNLARFVQ